MAFTYLTFAQAKAQVSARLGDEGQTFWLDDEIGMYVKEALSVWGAASNYWVESGNFLTTAGTAFYDLTTELPTLVGNTAIDQDQVQLMEYQLIEPVNTSWPTWAGSEQFSMDDLVQALQRRRNQFLEDTGIYIGVPDEFDVQIASEGLVQLDESVVSMRRVAWKYPDSNGNLDATHGVYVQLPRTDLFAANAQMPGWSFTPATPIQYIPYFYTPPTQLQLAPPPVDIGRLHLVSVKSGTDLDVSTGVLLGVDDDFVSYVRWGALADLLNMEGMAADPVRANYCEQRYREGVELAKLTFTAVQVQVNGVPVPLMAFDDFDNQIAGWQNDSGQPTECAMGNSTLIALHPVPDDQYSILVTAVRNAIQPTSDSSFLQIDKSILDAVLGYAVHLACFKLGGVEFTESMNLYEQLMRRAAGFNQVLAANINNFDVLSDDGGHREQELRPAKAA